jgi:hypothetical protein
VKQTGGLHGDGNKRFNTDQFYRSDRLAVVLIQ